MLKRIYVQSKRTKVADGWFEVNQIGDIFSLVLVYACFRNICFFRLEKNCYLNI